MFSLSVDGCARARKRSRRLGTGYAPAQCENYVNIAGDYYDQPSMYNAYTNLGYSSHFLTDVGNPLHTGMELEQALNSWVHGDYEAYVATNVRWSILRHSRSAPLGSGVQNRCNRYGRK